MDDKDLYSVTVRFYEELNDFVKKYPPKEPIDLKYRRKRSVKDLIESLGVPHTEVDLILINGKPVDFSYPVRNGDYISVYPMFEHFNIRGISPLREIPLRDPRFILDVHLGKLARRLRMLGFDTDYEEFRDDPELAALAEKEHRILLTCDRHLLMRRIVSHGMIIRNIRAEEQTAEVLNHLDLWDRISLFSRCINCNGILFPVKKGTEEYKQVLEILPRGVTLWCREFIRCTDCRQLYWKGSHFNRMEKQLEKIYSLRLLKRL